MSKDEMNIEVTCQMCLKRYRLTVNVDGYNEWREGKKLIQKCLPTLSAADRELLISSTCDPCFQKLFPPEEAG
jgi:hypothetical protein